MGQPCDQIDVDVVDASGAQTCDLRGGDGASMQAANGCTLLIHKRLHAEAGTIESDRWKGFKERVIQLTGGAFQRHFRLRGERKCFLYRLKYAMHLLRRQEAGRAAAEVEAVDS